MTLGVDEGSEFMSSVSSCILLWMLLALLKINFRFSTSALQLVLISEDGVKIGAWGFNWIDVKFSCWCTWSGLCFSVVIHDELMRVEVWRISVSGLPSLGGISMGGRLCCPAKILHQDCLPPRRLPPKLTSEQIFYQIALILEIYKKSPSRFCSDSTLLVLLRRNRYQCLPQIVRTF